MITLDLDDFENIGDTPRFNLPCHKKISIIFFIYLGVAGGGNTYIKKQKKLKRNQETTGWGLQGACFNAPAYFLQHILLSLQIYTKGEYKNINLDKHSYRKKYQDKSFSVTNKGYYELSSSVEYTSYEDFYYSLKKIRHLIANYYDLREHIIKIYNLDLQVMLIDISMALDAIELSNQDKQVLSDYMQGMSLSDIGRKYNFTRSNADFIIKKITKRVQDFLLGGDDK